MPTTLSVITICFNNLEELQRTCASVDTQLHPPTEHWIINGSTTIDIADWLAQNPQPAYRRWLNESDKGIADAFNKGIDKSNGEVLLMLNAADELADETTLQRVMPHFDKDASLMWLHGMYQYQRAGIWVVLGKPFETSKVYRGMRSICHQTMYVRRQLHQRHGLYNMHYRIAMDFDFLVRIRNEKFFFMPEVLAIFSPGGTSMQNMQKILGENTDIIHRHIGYSWKHRLWTLRLKILIALLGSPVGKSLYWLKVKMGLENK